MSQMTPICSFVTFWVDFRMTLAKLNLGQENIIKDNFGNFVSNMGARLSLGNTNIVVSKLLIPKMFKTEDKEKPEGDKIVKKFIQYLEKHSKESKEKFDIKIQKMNLRKDHSKYQKIIDDAIKELEEKSIEILGKKLDVKAAINVTYE